MKTLYPLLLLAVVLTGCVSRTVRVYPPSALEEAKPAGIRIALCSLFVEDQERALQFYTEMLGFEKKHDIPAGEFRWLTVTSPAGPEGVELLLEPNSHPAAQAYQKANFEDGIPAASLFATDLQAEYERLVEKGVEFKTPPTTMGDHMIAVFHDTCGNLIQLSQAEG